MRNYLNILSVFDPHNMSDEEPVSNNAASKLDVHEAYQVLLKVIKAKNMFMMNMKTSGKMTAES